jgi:hypothetical protein
MGTKIRLIGISNYGKNRIAQHGATWIVLEDRPNEFSLRSSNRTFAGEFDFRCVQKNNDPHFRVDLNPPIGTEIHNLGGNASWAGNGEVTFNGLPRFRMHDIRLIKFKDRYYAL